MLNFKGIQNSNNLFLRLFNTFLNNVFFVFCFMVAFSLLIFSGGTIERDVVGISMQPTLNKYGFYKSDVVYLKVADGGYQYGDIVVLRSDEKDIIKRVIGLPGDVIDIVQCKDGVYRLQRNGEIVEEDFINIISDVGTPSYNQNGMYTASEELDNLRILKSEMFNENGKCVVGENSLFVLGDNRGDSYDCSNYGPLEFSQVLGVVKRVRYYGQSEFNFYLKLVGSGDIIKEIGMLFK